MLSLSLRVCVCVCSLFSLSLSYSFYKIFNIGNYQTEKQQHETPALFYFQF